MKPVTEVLLNAAFAITPPENWTQNTIARDSAGIAISCDCESAARFCMSGALVASIPFGSDLYDSAFAFVHAAIGEYYVGDWNDTHTHAQVLRALYKAAALSELSP